MFKETFYLTTYSLPLAFVLYDILLSRKCLVLCLVRVLIWLRLTQNMEQQAVHAAPFIHVLSAPCPIDGLW